MTRITLIISSVHLAISSFDPSCSAQETTTTRWMFYSDTIGNSLDLTPDQSKRLNEWNARYEQDFDRLGDDGMQHRDYRDLQMRRNAELQEILTAPQFERWTELDDRRNLQSSNSTGGSPGPEMRREMPADPE